MKIIIRKGDAKEKSVMFEGFAWGVGWLDSYLSNRDNKKTALQIRGRV